MNKFNNKTIGLVGSLLILLCGCGNSHFEYKYYTNNDFYKDGVFQPDVVYIEISKAREMLGYSPVQKEYPENKVVAKFEDRLKLDK